MKTILHTSAGDITVELFPGHAPNTVNDFVTPAKGGCKQADPATGQKTSYPLYDGTIFHHIIPGFMIQGGDPLGTGTGGPGYQFSDEVHPELNFNDPCLLAMANAGKRVGKDTSGSQFFITMAPTPQLLGNHTIFGKVADEESKHVVDTITATPTGVQNRPVTEQVINSIEIIDWLSPLIIDGAGAAPTAVCSGRDGTSRPRPLPTCWKGSYEHAELRPAL